MKEIFNYDISGVTVNVLQAQNPPDVNINLLNGFKMAISEYLCYPQHIIAPRIDKYSNIAFVCNEMRISEIKPEIICETTKNAILSYLEHSC